MVPTEILAEQHADSLIALLEPTGTTVALLTSSVKGKREALPPGKIEGREIDILIGTHALIQGDVELRTWVLSSPMNSIGSASIRDACSGKKAEP